MSYKIAVDDGHGLETAGKQSPNKTKENSFNDAVKQYLIDELKRNNFEVVDCSPERTDNTLRDRCDRANKAKANIFISIHYNAIGDVWQNQISGIETYSYPGSSISKSLAETIHNQLISGLKRKDNGTKTANFYVLRNTNMPAILLELGYMDSASDYELMLSNDYRQNCASEICRGICKYFGISYKNKKEVKKEKLKMLFEEILGVFDEE
jgi:N-acetylmuramoyl-L-alanine amidase